MNYKPSMGKRERLKFGKLIKRFRKSFNSPQGHKQYLLAEAIGMKQSELSIIESGKRACPAKFVPKLDSVFNTKEFSELLAKEAERRLTK